MDKLSTRAECYGNNRSLFEWGSVGSGIWNTAQTAAHAEMTTLGTFMENYGVFWSSNNLNCNDDLEVIDYEGDHPNHDENGDHAKDVTEVYVAVIDELPHGDLENCDELFVNTNLSDAYTLNANNDLWTTVCNADFSANMEEASAWLSFELDRAGCLATN